jgi:N-acetylmuramoyl-L-alanine amidase/Domain of unknown function (DUF4280)
MGTEKQKAALETKRAEKKKKETQDSPAEKREVVMHGASLSCKYAQGLGKLVVTSNELLLQDQKWATENDGNNMVNLQFKGTCGHPKWPQRKMSPPPCMAVIKLSPWQNLGTNFIQEQRNLVKESYIECDPEFNSACAKPIPKVTSIEYKTNKVTNFKLFTNQEMELFETAHFKVTQYEINPPKDIDRKSVKWLIDYGTNKQDILNQSEELKLNVNDKDCYDSEFKVYAYIRKPNEGLFINVKVKAIKIKPRASWSARKEQTGGDYSYDKITTPLDQYYDTIVIHHSGNAKHFPNIKTIQDEHMDEMDKADIGYHFAVDKNGDIFEGRPIGIKGAHVDAANTGKIGIVLLGDLSTDNAGVNAGIFGRLKLNAEKKDGDDYITDKMEKGLLKLCIHLDRLYKIDFVAGHMEIAASANTDERYCPGNLTMAKMDKWRQILEKKKP